MMLQGKITIGQHSFICSNPHKDTTRAEQLDTTENKLSGNHLHFSSNFYRIEESIVIIYAPNNKLYSVSLYWNTTDKAAYGGSQVFGED